MFVYLPRRGWCGAAAIASALTIAACGPGNQFSSLRPDGPPEVLTVLVPAPVTGEVGAVLSGVVETATFCKTQGPNDGAAGAGDPQRPGSILTGETAAYQVCPADLTMNVPPVTTTEPATWYVRVQFDELLDGSVEDIVDTTTGNPVPAGTSCPTHDTCAGTLANTQPVTLECQSSQQGMGMVPIPYDGYYDPSGNSDTYPLGPSLVIEPTNPSLVATGAKCTIALKDNIKDKDGNPVPTDQRGTEGQYTWNIGPVSVSSITPADGTSVDPAKAAVDIVFNTAVSAFTQTGYTGGPNGSGAANSFIMPVSADGTEWQVPADFFANVGSGSATAYTYTLDSITDQCGAVTTLTGQDVMTTSFGTNPIALDDVTASTSPASGIAIDFNQYMDKSTLSAGALSLTDGNGAPVAIIPAALTPNGPSLVYFPDLALGSAYTFTVTSGATIKDCPGREDQLGSSCSATPGADGTFTNPSDAVAMFVTDSNISLLGVVDSAGANVSGATITPNDPVVLTFNTTITQASVAAAIATNQVTVVGSNGTAVVVTGAAGTPATLDPGTVTLAPATTWAPGDYTLTISGSAQFKDDFGAVIPAGSDDVIQFSVAPATPPTPTACY